MTALLIAFAAGACAHHIWADWRANYLDTHERISDDMQAWRRIGGRKP
jgi:hypothetical protein